MITARRRSFALIVKVSIAVTVATASAAKRGHSQRVEIFYNKRLDSQATMQESGFEVVKKERIFWSWIKNGEKSRERELDPSGAGNSFNCSPPII